MLYDMLTASYSRRVLRDIEGYIQEDGPISAPSQLVIEG